MNELYECNAWFYRERMDGRTCEWQLGMIKEWNARLEMHVNARRKAENAREAHGTMLFCFLKCM